MKKTGLILLIVLFLAVLIGAFHSTCFFGAKGIGTFDFEYRGFILPRLDFIKTNYSTGLTSLWNPFILCGTPFMAHPESQFFYLPRVASYLMFPPELSDRLFVFLHTLLMAVGVFVYVKLIAKSLTAASLAAALCAICGPTTVMIASGNEITLPMLSWWPFLLWATEKFISTQSKRYLFLITAFFWFSVMAQQIQLFFFMLFFYFFYVFVIVSGLESKKKAVVFKGVFLSFLSAILLSAIQVFPSMELTALSNRLRPYSVANSDPLKPYSLLSLIFSPVICFSSENYQGFVLFFGFSALLTAVFSLKLGKRLILFGVYCVLIIAMSFGFPLYELFYKFFPFGKYMNGGEELTFILSVLLPVMIGCGWVVVRKKINSSLFLGVLYLIIIAECLFWGLCYYKNVKKVTGIPDYSVQERDIKNIVDSKDPLGRFIKFGDSEYVFQDNLSMSYRIFGIGGFYNFTYKKYCDLFSSVDRSLVGDSGVYGESPDIRAIANRDNLSLPLFDMMNVRYVISFEDLNSAQYALVYDNGGVKLYDNKNCLPRAFFVSSYEVTNSPDKTISSLISRSFDPLKKVYLTKTPVWLKEASNNYYPAKQEVRIIEYKPDRILLLVETPKDSLLFISDTFYPGWRAAIDDKPTEIYEANYSFRCIAVPQGRHQVVLYYYPKALVLGFIAFLCGIAILLFLLKSKFCVKK